MKVDPQEPFLGAHEIFTMEIPYRKCFLGPRNIPGGSGPSHAPLISNPYLSLCFTMSGTGCNPNTGGRGRARSRSSAAPIVRICRIFAAGAAVEARPLRGLGPHGGSVIECPSPLNVLNDAYGHSWY